MTGCRRRGRGSRDPSTTRWPKRRNSSGSMARSDAGAFYAGPGREASTGCPLTRRARRRVRHRARDVSFGMAAPADAPPSQLRNYLRPRGSQQHEARVLERGDLRHGGGHARACRSLGWPCLPLSSRSSGAAPAASTAPTRGGCSPRSLATYPDVTVVCGEVERDPGKPGDRGEPRVVRGGPERGHRGVRPWPEARPLPAHPVAGRGRARLPSHARDRIWEHTSEGAWRRREFRSRSGRGDRGAARAPLPSTRSTRASGLRRSLRPRPGGPGAG